jgi:hypothetical protein
VLPGHRTDMGRVRGWEECFVPVGVCVWLSSQVEPGEFMFYPSGYWHQTENLADENISVSGSVVDANCYEAIKAEFEQECSTTKQRFAFSPPVCQALRIKCYPWWEAAFKGAFTTGTKSCPAKYKGAA